MILTNLQTIALVLFKTLHVLLASGEALIQ